MRKFFRRIWRSWFPQHILYVNHRGAERVIHVKDFKKRTPRRIVGVNLDGEEFEINSVEPMDYYIEEYRDDLK
jgi:hypothetical protein